MGKKWLDTDIDGRRLNRIIRLLETHLKNAQEDDKIIRYANAITYVTSKKLELTYKVLELDSIIAKIRKKQKKEMYGV